MTVTGSVHRAPTRRYITQYRERGLDCQQCISKEGAERKGSGASSALACVPFRKVSSQVAVVGTGDITVLPSFLRYTASMLCCFFIEAHVELRPCTTDKFSLFPRLFLARMAATTFTRTTGDPYGASKPSPERAKS